MQRHFLPPILLFLCALFPLSAENLFHGDSSYEIGAGHLRSNWSGQGAPLEILSAPSAPVGECYASSIVEPLSKSTYTGDPMPLQAGVPYLFSCWIRAEKPIVCQFVTVHTKWKDTQFHPIAVTTQWQRIAVPFTVAFDHEYNILLQLTNHTGESVRTDFDAIQLERNVAQPSSFEEEKIFYSGMSIPSSTSGVFFVGEPVVARLSARDCREGASEKIAWQCRVTNEAGEQLLHDASEESSTPPVCHETLSLPSAEPGFYIVHTTWSDSADAEPLSEQTETYAVVRPPEPPDPTIPAYLGYCGGDRAGLTRLGARWMEVDLHWWQLMPTPDTIDYAFFEKQIRALKEQGFLVKFSMVHLPGTPNWSHRPEEVAEAKSWGLPETQAFFPTDEALAKLSAAFEELIRRVGSEIDLLEIGGEDELISGSEPYYRKKYPDHVVHGEVRGPVCRDIAKIATVYLQAARRARANIPIAVGRPSGGTPQTGDFDFSREVLEQIQGEFDFFPMDCYPFGMRYINEQNLLHLGSANRDFPGVFERANRMTTRFLNGQKPFVSEYGFAIDNRLPPDDPLQCVLVSKMLAAVLTAKALGSPYFFWFLTGRCLEANFFEYGLWQKEQPMPAVPAISQVVRVVEGVRTMESRLGSAESNLKLALFGQANRAVLALWSESTPNPVSLSVPEGSVLQDSVGKTLPLPKDGRLVATTLPQYLFLDGADAYERLRETLETAEDGLSSLRAALEVTTPADCALVIESTLPGDDSLVRCEYTFEADEAPVILEKPSGTPLPWRIPLVLPENAHALSLCLEDAAGRRTSSTLDFNATRLANGANLFAAFGDSRADITPADPWIRWDGKKDLGGEIHLEVTTDTLCITAEIFDDEHFNNNPPTRAWNGDCLQVVILPGATIDSDSAPRPMPPNAVDLCMALTKDGAIAYNYGRPEFNSLKPGTDYEIRRDDEKGVTSYRLTLSRKALDLEKDCQYFRMACVVFDDDEGSGQAYFYQSSPGITGSKNTGTIQLLQTP